MKQLILSFFLTIMIQESDNHGVIFDDPDSVTIILSELQSNEIPNSIWDSVHIKKLTIRKNRLTSTWKTYPPLSWYETRELAPPFWELPNEIGSLKNLEYLYLVDLDINSLPETIAGLQKIKILNLSLNKLTLHNELEKFKQLKNLKDLKIMGNHYDSLEMKKFKKDFQHIDIKYTSEDK
ncbi:MAG: hypothetical protein AAGC64_12245 [Bacteroidota bacterium]